MQLTLRTVELPKTNVRAQCAPCHAKPYPVYPQNVAFAGCTTGTSSWSQLFGMNHELIEISVSTVVHEGEAGKPGRPDTCSARTHAWSENWQNLKGISERNMDALVQRKRREQRAPPRRMQRGI